jgi:hypothetical protein
LREDSKDLLGSVENAQSIFLIRDDVNLIDWTIQIENGVEHLIHKEKDQTFSAQDRYKRLMRSAQWEIEDLDNSIDSITRLQNKIPRVVASGNAPTSTAAQMSCSAKGSFIQRRRSRLVIECEETT